MTSRVSDDMRSDDGIWSVGGKKGRMGSVLRHVAQAATRCGSGCAAKSVVFAKNAALTPANTDGHKTAVTRLVKAIFGVMAGSFSPDAGIEAS